MSREEYVIPNKLTGIQLKQGSSLVCSATEGEASTDRATVKLMKGITWAVPAALTMLQKQVTLTATIHDAGVPTKSFAKPMYVSGIVGNGTVRLTDKKEG